MEKIARDIFSFFISKDFYLPLIAVFFVWLLAFIPQKRQNIQQTFFELLKNQNDILSRIKDQNSNYFQNAKDNLIQLYDLLTKGETLINENDVVIKMPNSSYINDESLIRFFNDKPIKTNDQTYINYQRKFAEYIYSYFFEKNLIYVGHYFRHFYNVIKYINKNRFLINAKFYAALIQAQMAAPELFVLFYNGLFFPKVEYFINKYNLVENLSINDLMNVEHFAFYKCKMKFRNIHSWNKLGRH